MAPVAVIASTGPGLDALDGLGVELGERGRRVGDHGEDAGEGAEPDRGHEHQRVDERVHAPEEVEHGARRVEDAARGATLRADRKPSGSASTRGHRGAEQRDLDRLDRAGQRRPAAR